MKVLVSASFVLVRSESVTWVTAQILRAATPARCGVAPGNGGILLAAKMVTCPLLRRSSMIFCCPLPPYRSETETIRDFQEHQR